MNKQNIVFIKPGATVSITEVGLSGFPLLLGYTRGISFTPEYTVEKFSNQKAAGFIRSVLTGVGGKLQVKLLELSQTNLNLLFMEGLSVTPYNYILTIQGINKESSPKTLTITLNNVTLESVGEIKLSNIEEATLDLTFQALLDADGKMGSLILS